MNDLDLSEIGNWIPIGTDKDKYEGVFDGVTYAVMSFINMFKSKEERKYSSLYDYKQKKHAVKTKTGFILISGLIILTFGIVFYILYSRV